MKKIELYIHIPFCVRKCEYCDFVSGPATASVKEAYHKALLKEIETTPYQGEEVSTIFIGGGTPTSVPSFYIEEIMELLRKRFLFAKDAEITMEANPGTVTKESLAAYKRAGINRLSFGLQSADNRELAFLGRIHTFEEFEESYRLAREAGFGNINVDLMSALPGQTIESYRETLKKIIDLKPEHISAYSLIIEEGTPFYERYHEEDEARYTDGERMGILPTEEEERQMYYDTQQFLANAGFIHYEISNYAKPGRACRHNIGYWDGTWYLGFGLAASSYYKEMRYTNCRELSQYIDAAGKENMLSKIREEVNPVDETSAKEEFMFLGLRMMRGISVSEFEARFETSFEDTYGEIVRKLVREGLLLKEGDRIALTASGIDVSNYVLSEFLIE